MGAKIRNIIILIVVLALLTVGGIARYLQTRTVFNTGYPKGNTAGNLYNTGLFCEKDNTVYFANPDDDYRLYAMDRSGANLKKLCDDTVSYINVDDHYIYYVRNNKSKDDSFSFLHVNTNALCRIDRDGGKVKILDPQPSIYASIVGNYIYYLHYDKTEATTLYRVKIDGKEKEQVTKEPYFTCCTEDRFLYFNGLTNDHNIYRYDTENGQLSTLLFANAWMPIVQNGKAYYMDPEHNYALVQTDLTTQESNVITTDRVDCFTIYGETAIYQKNDETSPALMRVKLDGTGKTTIADGNFRNLSLIGSELYFRPFGDDNTVYHTSAVDFSYRGTFHPGKAEEK